MLTRFLHKILLSALILMCVSNVLFAQDELCTDGILLFREDFGGNDPNDPAVGRTAVSGMSSGYNQIYKLQTSDPGTGMGAGSYLVAKRGYRNSSISTYSVWHVMDDHTYFGDTTRGYLLEIDGTGSGNDVFYSTVIDGLCAGSRLTFSAYVANLTTAGQYNAWRSRNYVHPKLSFVLTHPKTGEELARYNTDTISHDWSNYPKSWKETAEWQLVGMNFTVPEGIDSVRLSIRNNASGSSTGNDFALDDIEIRLCLTPDTILSDTLVCDTTHYISWREKTFAIADTLRDTIFNSCGLDSVYYILNVQTEHCKEPLCTSGILLFREDFGGNKPEDPKISTTPVSGMSYTQVTTDALGSMGSGKYLVTKQGYCNGNGTSQWHLQDDHTYFGDLTRGYFMEIDGRGDQSAFYSTTIDGLCEGIGLTFSAYVANVMTWGMYIGRPGVYAYPRLKFVLTNPLDNSELATYDTGDIPFDSAFIGDNMCWQQSVEWQLVGMNFTVPNGVDQIQLTIYNNTTGSNGNDFAIDDIEIHLCMTPDTVVTDTLLCDTISKIQWREKSFVMADTLRDTVFSSCGFDSIYYVLNIQTEHCEEPEPVLCTDGILLFREDFGGNNPSDPRVSSTPVPGMSYRQSTHGMGSGTYMVTKSGYCNGDTTGWTIPGADLSTKRSQWYIQDDHTYPNDYTRGYFVEIDGNGGNQQFYQTEISGLCEGIELTFSAYVANVFTWFQYDWYTRNRGPVISPCLKFVLTNPQTGATLAEKNTQEIPFDENLPAKTDWQYSSAWHLVGMNFTVPVGVDAIRLTIYNNVTNGNGNDFALDDIEIHLCMTPDTVRTDTLVCDTLPQITWREKSFTMADTLRDTLRSSCGFDSIYYVMKVETEHCEPPIPPCPEMLIITADTMVCDTLMPYRWRDTLFVEPTTYEILYKDQRDCDSLLYILTLSTEHCERPDPPTPPDPPEPPDPPQPQTQYPLIVNKYNWQLLLDNVTFRKLFPERTATTMQWYKNDEPIPGATDDDYSEQNELNGRFQLRIELDNNQTIWSNILIISDTKEEAPIEIKVYRWQNLYMIRYEQGEKVWTEKRLIP